MDDQEIRIVTLPAMRVATFYAYGLTPELDAWQKVIRWAKPHGYWREPPATRIFGFNHPGPSEGSPNRGYEYWLTVGTEVQSTEEVKVKEFSGGKYGVLRCNVTGDPYEMIPASWGKLIHWQESGHYGLGNHQCLEEHLNRQDDNSDHIVLDLYLPIRE